MDFKSYNFQNKRALVRVDFNVPLDENGRVTDDTRIKMALPTINWIIKAGGSVVLLSHLGRPNDEPDSSYSLRQIIPCLENLLNKNITFCNDCIDENSQIITENLKPGCIVLLENLRFYKEEKLGDEDFAKTLSKHGDVYVNDAFGTAHRAHASTSIIANFFPNDKMFGFLIQNEIKSVETVLNSSKYPLTAIVGGAKVSSKITIILKLIEKVDHLIIGGGMAYTFIKAQKGSIGKSLVEEDYLDLAIEILDKAKKRNVQIHLPSDALCCKEFDNNSVSTTRSIYEIPNDEMGLDIGEDSIKNFEEVIKKSSLILWNGPMGVFEMSNFQKGTQSVANAIVSATENNAFSLIGGGDSVAAINLFKLADKVSHVSTGGGAMLEYLEGKELPGIKSIRSL